MIKFENTEVIGWKSAIRGMRNPMNSWSRSDSHECYTDCTECLDDRESPLNQYVIGDNDLTLIKQLAKAGTDHRKFMRMIVVYVDITAPLYWWKEFDTYKVGTVRNSCSTMHKIADKEFTLDDFSYEHLLGDIDRGGFYSIDEPLGVLALVVEVLNEWRESYLKSKDKDEWWQMIQLLPSSYNQKSTLMLNYEVLANIYKSRKNHKLDEWVCFTNWIEQLPHSELITGGDISET